MVAAKDLPMLGLQRHASSILTAHPVFCFQVPPMIRSKHYTAFVSARGKIANTWFIACFSEKKPHQTLLKLDVTLIAQSNRTEEKNKWVNKNKQNTQVSKRMTK